MLLRHQKLEGLLETGNLWTDMAQFNTFDLTQLIN